MLEITKHKVNGLNEKIAIHAVGEPGPGGAYSDYKITIGGLETNIHFQEGIDFFNGLSNEALLAVVEHRLNCFQEGPFACMENMVAAIKVREALELLHKRTLDRVA